MSSIAAKTATAVALPATQNRWSRSETHENIGRPYSQEADGYTATRHQREVGTAYFDEVSQVISEGDSSTTALHGSTEAEQFH